MTAVPAALPATTVEALREENARLTAHIAQYTVNEPSIAEELAYRSSEMDRLEDERDRARCIAVTLEQELAELQAAVQAFTADRAKYISAIRDCHPHDVASYYRWQGHAESRRVLSERLGLPVAWPAEDGTR